ncbi:MAG TPA: glycoside hydrolase family 3 C-terminal domain-containing protein [Bryobacteraceae bacterium]|nr:glycoside hydrolase family 3 C-terminal domain-containing protein [Bryobacteraceae bacterium]
MNMFTCQTARARHVALAVGLIFLGCVGPAGAQQQGAASLPFMNPSLPLDQRVDDVVSRLTMEEKAGQLVNTAAAIPRLGIPAYNWWNESLHGLVSGNVTVFTQVIGLGATFNAPLIKQMSTVIGTEARARYNQSRDQQQQPGGMGPGRGAGLDFWAPNINIFRDPRWGRGQETYGEDPFLTGRMAVNFVRGMQGDDPKYFKTISTPKHFAVHSGPEPTRHFEDVSVSLHDIEDTYLPAFRAALVDAKADSVMCAYNRINGEAACSSKFLLQDTLRGAWKFNGYVVSDCGAISDIYRKPGVGHHIVDTLPQAAALSLKTGTDSDCAMSPDVPSYLEAMQKGLISQQEVDVNLKRLFKARLQLGMFDPPEMVPYSKISPSEVDTPEHRALALNISRQAMVLLKNDGILPLKSGVKTIAVVGPLADNDGVLRGNYSGTSTRYTTIIDGIRKEFSGATVTYTPGTKFQRNAVVIPQSALKTARGEPGVDAVYFNNKTLSGQPAASRVEPQIGSAPGGFGMGGGGGRGAGQPASRLPAEVNASGDFSGRWTATLTAPESGKCEFTVTVNGGVRVSIDGKQIVNDWVQRAIAGRGMAFGGPGVPERTAEMSLEKGKTYQVVVEFFRDAAEVTAQTNAAAGANAAAAAAAATFGGGGRAGAMPVTGPTLSWNYGYDQEAAIDAARKADVVIAVVGITSQLEGEQGNTRGQLPEGFQGGDRTSIDLPRDEETLLQAIKATGKPLIVTLVNGSALAVNWADQNANAILEAWYPGEDGGQAVAETLAGVNNPAGRLPITFYKGLADLAPFNDYNMTNRTYRYYRGTPLYPFGYGLSYSKFEYGNLKLSTDALQAGSDLTVDVDVTNTSSIAGDEVAQLYLVFPRIPGAPLRALRGFERVNIPAGQTRHVKFTLNPRDLSCVSEDGETRVAPGAYKVFVGGGQPDTKAPGKEVALTIQGEQKLPR